MTSLAFPQFPALNETYTLGDRSWKWNGLGWEKLSAGGQGQGPQPYVISVFAQGNLLPGEMLASHVAPFSIQFPADATGSKATSFGPALQQTDISILKNEDVVATLRFAEGATTASFLPSDAFSLAAGDVLSFPAPDPADASLGDVAITLVGTR